MKKILVVLFLFCCNWLQAQNNITEITYERTPCFGKCPSYRVSLNSDGNITYDGFKDTKLQGYYLGKISSSKAKAIFKKYKSRKLLTLPNVYKNTISDISKLHISIVVNNKNKDIRNAHMGPAYLQQITKDIDALMVKEKINWQKGNEEDISTVPIALEEPVSEPVHWDVLPSFPGGEEALNNYIHAVKKYPQVAAEVGIEGKVLCSFMVEKDGSISQVKVERGLGYGCDEEAIRVLQSMPKWNPALLNGQRVSKKMNIPVNFHLE